MFGGGDASEDIETGFPNDDASPGKPVITYYRGHPCMLREPALSRPTLTLPEQGASDSNSNNIQIIFI